jgi:hypothetical protein
VKFILVIALFAATTPAFAQVSPPKGVVQTMQQDGSPDAPEDPQPIPLPRPRPVENATPLGFIPLQQNIAQPDVELEEANACRIRLTLSGAIAPSIPPLSGPGGCGAPDAVRLEAVTLKDNTRVALMPAPLLRCTMAEEVVQWVREDVAPIAQRALGAALRRIENFDSYDCRGRNRVIGSKLSEHGRANALDVRSLKLADGKSFELTDRKVAHDLRDQVRVSACARFMTVLGPGSDGYHEEHIHVDLAERRGNFRMCQWNVLDPPPDIPLPPPRPSREDLGSIEADGIAAGGGHPPTTSGSPARL